MDTPSRSTPSNEEWLQFLFDNLPEGALPIGCSFDCSPNDVDGDARYKWRPWPLPLGALRGHLFGPTSNNYCSISSFYPDQTGKYRRDLSRFACLHALMVDDIGPKVPPAAVLVMPSALIETSPANFQAWYKLDPPLHSVEAATVLVNALGDKLRHDGKSANRLGRMPVGANRKHSPPFPHVVRHFDGSRHDPMSLVKAYGLQLKAPDSRNVVPHPTADLTARWLMENGYVKRVRENGWIELHCPLGSHDDGEGTAYQPPTPGNPNGHFKCQHAKCYGKNTIDLLTFIESKVLAKMRGVR